MTGTNDRHDGAAEPAGPGAEQEPSLWEMIAETFRGRHRWMTCLVWGYGLLFTAGAVVAAVRFFAAGTTRGQILWATVFAVAAMMIMALKMWYWMLLNRNTVLRAVRRLERRLEEAARRSS